MQFNYLITLCLFVYSSDCVGLNSKLDFGASHIVSTNNKKTTHYEVTKKETKKEDFENISLICISNGCNKTLNEDTGGDEIKTDIHVHVQTSVNNNKTKSQLQDETPDIPVVIGYAGVKSDSSSLQDDAPSLHDVMANQDDARLILDQSTGLGDAKITLTSTNNLNAEARSSLTNLLPPYQPLITENYYLPPLEASPNYAPSLEVTLMQLPRQQHEKSYRHYFGENSAPNAWFGKNAYNPVAFNANVPKWQPSTWFNTVPHTHDGKEIVQKTLHWYPEAQGRHANRRVNSNDPGSQINDKLAPLN